MKRIVILALLSSCFVVTLEHSASACTCVPLTDMKTVLGGSDGAFVGAFIGSSIDESGKDSPFALYEFRVHAVYKGRIPDIVFVRSGRDSAACGIAAREGDRIGLFLEREQDVWASSSCSQVSAADMRRTGVRPSGPIDVEAAEVPLAQRANAIPVEALWAAAAALLLLTVALMLARQRTAG